MTLLKQCMGWGIGSTHAARKGRLPKIRLIDFTSPTPDPITAKLSSQRQISSPQFRTLSWRLMLSYLGAMVAVIGFSSVAAYQFFAYSLYKQLDYQLGTVADAATHNFSAIQTNRSALQGRLPQTLDQDGDLDIPWQDLRGTHQSVEWLDAKQQRLASVGEPLLETRLVKNFQPWQHHNIRTLTIPVYLPKAARNNQPPQGYVRVSTSTTEIEAELKRLNVGLGVGGAIAVILIGGTGWWLTRRSLHPIEQSMQQLQQFTADASHELRSPLTAIKTAIEVMQSHPERVHPTDQQKVMAIASATQQMTYLVEDLLLLTRTDSISSQPSIDGIPIPINEVLEDLLESLQPQIITKGIALQANQFNELWVKGDANQLRRLLLNLLDNAIKYTPNQGTIHVTLTNIDAVIAIQVKDTGMGIAPEQLPLVFDRFWRADQARSHPEGGSGLGLAIAQAIAHAHAGKITVSSQIGMGSCFQVQLPRLKRI